MKKFLFILSTLGLLLAPAIANAEFAVGLTISKNSLDTDGQEDVDSNNTIDATKSVSDDFTIASFFAEYAYMGDRFGVVIGIDAIPGSADIDKRSITQDACGAKASGGCPHTSSGTNSVEGTVEDHRTVYIQPGLRVGDSGMFYLTYGSASADINGKSVSITHTDINETKSLDGETLGVGFRRVSDAGIVFKLDYSKTEYDQVSFKTDNDTTATADLDNSRLALSIGKQF